MASICQVYDETNSVVLFDLNDPSAANVGDNGYSSTELLADVDLGEPAHEFSRFSSPGTDGGSTVNSRAGFRQLTIPVRIRASSYDNLTTAVGKLSNYLRSGCVIRWQANTSANVRYIDVEPSPAPYVLDGRELSMYLATSLIDTPEGLELVLTAQPYLRGAELDSPTNVLTNATLLRDSNLDGTPDNWTLAAGTWSIPATSEALRISYTGAGAASLGYQQFAAAAGTQLTASVEARVISGTGGAMISLYSHPALVSNASSSISTSASWTRLTVTHTVAGGDSAMRFYIRQGSGSGTSVYEFRKAQMETGATASTFRVGSETGSVDPASGMGRLFPFYNPGDAPAPVKVQFTNTTTSIGGAYVGVVSNRAAQTGASYLPEFLNRAHLIQFEDHTNGTDTAGSVQANASPGSGTSSKLTTYVTTTMVSRVTGSITTAATLAALRGKTFIPMIRYTGSGATYNGDVNLIIRWGTGSTGTTLEASIIAAAGTYEDMPLDPITFPDTLPDAVTFDLQSSRTSGTGNTIWDCLTFRPTEPAATYVANAPVTIGTTRAFKTDPASSRISVVTTSTGADYSGSIGVTSGPILFWAPPGLSLFYVVMDTGGNFITARGDTQTVKFTFAPRWSG